MKNMNKLLDFYVDSYGRKFETHSVGKQYVYLRSDHHGHIKNKIVPLTESGDLDFSKAMDFNERTAALAFIYKTEGSYPERYVTSQAREILARYGK